jgi:dihydroorotate dehydrogenase
MNLFKLCRFLIYFLDPEIAHKTAMWLLKNKLIIPKKKFRDLSLESKVAGIKFKNPVGLAAGFDKNAEAFNSLAKFNFGFLEFGTVTPMPQAGNAKPRLFRLTNDKAIINRMGFNNVGAEKFQQNIVNANYKNITFGINIGKNKDSQDGFDDYFKLLDLFADLPTYFTVNISSPNTKGLRDLQKKDVLENFIKELKNSYKAKIFLKIAPDLTDNELKDICNIALKYAIDALIISNTTISRNYNLTSKYRNENGGLSGKPLYELSNKKITYAYKILQGNVPIIGSGGIFSAKDAYQKIKAGANLVQLYSGIIYEGFYLAYQINKDLVKLMAHDGYKNISEVVGSDVKL